MSRTIDRSEEIRDRMVREQIAARGVLDRRVLAAMRRVPRELFLKEGLEEFAYQDTPLPIESDQTISQPFIVAYMTEALGLRGGEKVLEIGTGSGYAAAVLAEIAGEVYTVERYANLAENAAARLARLGYRNVHGLTGDGTRGWPEHAPYDAIIVAAGGPEVPPSLREQLAIGGRLVIPVGPTTRSQQLVRVTRLGEHHFDEEDLMAVTFVPLIGEQGWREGVESPSRARPSEAAPKAIPARPLISLLTAAAEPFEKIETADLDALYSRIGDARVVLLGEATHGTREFYRLRARITRDLIERKGFTIVAAEADWPDAARIDHYVRDLEHPAPDWVAFTRFPTWMWRNHEVRELVDWLRERNGNVPAERRAGFTASTSTASTRRSAPCFNISTRWTRRPRRSRASAMVACPRGNRTRRPTATPRSPSVTPRARARWYGCSRISSIRGCAISVRTASAISTRCRTPGW